MGVPAEIGAYRVQRLLGVGSFATVWLAHDPVLRAHVAIKVLAENWHHDVRVRERFLDEARLLRRIDDDRLVRVRQVGELADGRPYTVLDWADGGSLRERLAAGMLPVATALDVLVEVAAGVAVLHRHRVVHRDLTPGNILFGSGPDGDRVLIADLGLAKALAAASGLTMRAGTPGYMAPEQDDPLAVVDERADVYALGRLGLRLLGSTPADPARAGGDPPTAGQREAGQREVGQRETGLRTGVPAAVAQVLRRAGATDPADRYPDAAAFRAALLSACAPAAPPGPRAGPPRTELPVGPADRRRAGTWLPAGSGRLRWLLGVGSVLVLVLTGGVVAADSGPVATIATSGPVSVVLPAGWRAAGTGWAGRYDEAGQLEPALVISPEPRKWASDPRVPGAFLGLSAIAARHTGPAGFVAEQPHADCTAAPVRQVRRGGLDWVIARFDCPHDRPVLVEAAARTPVGLLYAQVVPPPDVGDEFVDALLDGVRVR
ncbi:serine/threonine-protein kinase [Micromonospora sp. FIMYZ51]|uniref:serine/threonine-protein kinase n=1 Tax=Micromonospora sp. FIMYZ51 TaxID=3051832 RepID=UPI00311EF2EC